MPNFRTKRGQLTAYALACGYVDRYSVGDYTVQLSRLSSGAYEVYVWGGVDYMHTRAWTRLATARHEYKLWKRRLAVIIASRALGVKTS